MHGLLIAWVLCLGLAAQVQPAASQSASDEPTTEKTTDAFFAGTVVETTTEKITVTRTVLGKAENHSFAVNADTKVEGKLRTKIRVTVRYIPGEDGDTATMIIVRSASKKK